MLLKLRFGLKSLVVANRMTPPGNTRSSPATGNVPPLQLAAVAQLPLELPSQVLVAPTTVMLTEEAKRMTNVRAYFIRVLVGVTERLFRCVRSISEFMRHRQISS